MGLLACGSDIHGRVVVHVDGVAITEDTVSHWMATMVGGRAASDHRFSRDALRRQALGFLISSEWLLGETAREGLKVTEEEIKNRFAARKSALFPGGEREFHQFLEATGQTVADMMFETKTELASAKIRQALTSREPMIARTQVIDYYAQHAQRFTIPESRDLEITNRKTRAEAETLKREVELGKSFASVAQRETLKLSTEAYSASRGTDAFLTRAIHAARLNVLIGPLKQHVDYYLFEVKRITPSRRQELMQVQGAIRQRLVAEQRHRTLARFNMAWRKRWIALTDCHFGYVVPGCRQDKTPEVTREDVYAFN